MKALRSFLKKNVMNLTFNLKKLNDEEIYREITYYYCPSILKLHKTCFLLLSYYKVLEVVIFVCGTLLMGHFLSLQSDFGENGSEINF